MIGIAACWARTASGVQAPAVPTIPLMKSRRRIASPRGFRSAPTVAYRDAITAGIYDRRNGVQGSVCTAPIPSRPCPLWVKSRHDALKSRCPLYPQQRTSVFSRYFRAYPEIGWPGVRSMAMVRTRSRGIKDAALGHAAGLARAPDAIHFRICTAADH